jgi:hypothetical protein
MQWETIPACSSQPSDRRNEIKALKCFHFYCSYLRWSNLITDITEGCIFGIMFICSKEAVTISFTIVAVIVSSWRETIQRRFNSIPIGDLVSKMTRPEFHLTLWHTFSRLM